MRSVKDEKAAAVADSLEAGGPSTAANDEIHSGAPGASRLSAAAEMMENAKEHSRKTHRFLIALEGKLHYLLVNLPVALPLTLALFCTYLLLFQDTQPALDTPWLFQLALLFCLLAGLGWITVKVLYGFVFTVRGLHPRQSLSTWGFLLVTGLIFFIVRLAHLIWFSTLYACLLELRRP